MDKKRIEKMIEICGDNLGLGYEKTVDYYGRRILPIFEEYFPQEILQALFDIGILHSNREMLEFCERMGRDLKVDREKLTRGYLMTTSPRLLVEFAEEKGILIEYNEEQLQECLDDTVARAFVSGFKRIDRLATERGLNLEPDLEILSKTYNELFERGEESGALRSIAASKFIDLQPSVQALLSLFNSTLSKGYQNFSKLYFLIRERGLEEGISEESFQKGYVREVIKKRRQRSHDNIVQLRIYEKLAERLGFELRIDEEILQGEYECDSSLGLDEKVELIEKIAEEEGIKLKEYEPESTKPCREFLIEKEVDGHQVILRSGKIMRDNKFILGHWGDKFKLVYDNGVHYHKEIKENEKFYSSEDYISGNRPCGGGRLDIDLDGRNITICRRSTSYGYEPRIVTADLLSMALPDFEIKVRK